MERYVKGIICIKYVTLILLVVFISSLLVSAEISNVELEDVADEVISAVNAEKLSYADNRMVKRLYNINANDYEGVALYVSDSNMNVEEILIVKLKDTEQAEEVEEAISKRLDRQLKSFEGYGPEQCKLLNDHILDTRGNYILFAVSNNAEMADEAFRNSL